MRAACLLLLAAAAFAGELVPAELATIRSTLSREGVFLPGAPHELSFDLDAYRGELRLAEIAPHGGYVNEGDVVARVVSRPLEEQLAKERLDLAQAEMAVRHAETEARLLAEKQARALTAAQVAAERAAKRLRGYREHEKPHERERERLDVQGSQNRIEDIRDELEQLEKMYGEDELVDATEEIVLSRQRRNFARTTEYFELDQRQRAYRHEFYDSWGEEDLVRALEERTQDLEAMRVEHEMRRAEKAMQVERARFDVEKKRRDVARLEADLAALVVRAPARGVFVHGDAASAPYGTRLEPGDDVKARQVFASVCPQGGFEFRTTIPESRLLEVSDGAAVEVTPAGLPGVTLTGRLSVEYLASGKDKDEGNLYRARVRFEKPDPRLRPGMLGTGLVVLEQAREAVVIPLAAVTERDGSATVRVGAGKEPRVVKLGVRDGQRVAVKEGLRPGEEVVVE